jgi:hypothetical protein
MKMFLLRHVYLKLFICNSFVRLHIIKILMEIINYFYLIVYFLKCQ